MAAALTYRAGIYDQCSDHRGDACDCDGGWERIAWSRHRTAEAAAQAARKYQRQQSSRTGGALTWSAWWSEPDGSVHRIDPHHAG